MEYPTDYPLDWDWDKWHKHFIKVTDEMTTVNYQYWQYIYGEFGEKTANIMESHYSFDVSKVRWDYNLFHEYDFLYFLLSLGENNGEIRDNRGLKLKEYVGWVDEFMKDKAKYG